MPERDEERQFIRDIATRHERVWRDQATMLNRMLGGLEEVQTGLREVVAELRDTRGGLAEVVVGIREIATELRDTRDERRAQTLALLRVIDRLENGGAQA